MTAGADTRWSQRDGSMSEVRYCDWPGCPSRYPLPRGPALRGWREFGITRQKVTLCPFHSVGPHLPRLILPHRDVPLIVVECTCDWTIDPGLHVSPLIREWQIHVETTEMEASA